MESLHQPVREHNWKRGRVGHLLHRPAAVHGRPRWQRRRHHRHRRSRLGVRRRRRVSPRHHPQLQPLPVPQLRHGVERRPVGRLQPTRQRLWPVCLRAYCGHPHPHRHVPGWRRGRRGRRAVRQPRGHDAGGVGVVRHLADERVQLSRRRRLWRRGVGHRRVRSRHQHLCVQVGVGRSAVQRAAHRWDRVPQRRRGCARGVLHR